MCDTGRIFRIFGPNNNVFQTVKELINMIEDAPGDIEKEYTILFFIAKYDD